MFPDEKEYKNRNEPKKLTKSNLLELTLKKKILTRLLVLVKYTKTVINHLKKL